MITIRARRARKTHIACFGQCPPIQPGEVYLEHKEFPGADSGTADAAGHPVRMAECRACAQLYGRGHRIAAREECSMMSETTCQESEYGHICHQCGQAAISEPNCQSCGAALRCLKCDAATGSQPEPRLPVQVGQ